MRTRTSPRNQERLWRILGGSQPKPQRAILHLVVRTENGQQTLSCGHSVPLPPCWSGRYPRERRCFECEAA